MNWPINIVTEGKEIIETLDFSNTFPKKDEILKFLNVNPSNIKVVIIGQDPYPTPGVANGNAFAVNKGIKLPGSLLNIFKEIKEVQGEVYTDCTLESWVHQGVLLLNSALTVESRKPNSHKHLWQNYTKKIIKFLDDNFDIIWVLWGKEAETICQNVKGRKIIDFHPSPLSFYKRKRHTFKELNFIKW